MFRIPRVIRIVMADDDKDDQQMVKRAFTKAHLPNPLDFVNNGEELMAFLRREEPFAAAELPDLVLLDLNMPRKNGWEVLEEVKADPDLRRIPVIVLSSSSSDSDLRRAYDLGANSYLTKPMDFDDLVSLVRSLAQYWFHAVQFPEPC